MEMTSGYKSIDLKTWKRAPYYEYYAHGSKGMCAMTGNIDVSSLYSKCKASNKDFLISILYVISIALNKHEEFKVGYCAENGELMIWDEINPIFRVFHKDTELFTRVWTKFTKDFKDFYDGCRKTIDEGLKLTSLNAHDIPDNAFEISHVPFSFTSVNVKMSESGKYFSPILTTGKTFEENGTVKMPIAMQISHAVADGFHIARFFDEVKEEAEKLAGLL
ncbi:MAG: hypothetical protein J6X37_05030 [Treponema sp.]|nr:hypothetical protein [Treponema sp.]